MIKYLDTLGMQSRDEDTPLKLSLRNDNNTSMICSKHL
ncbi:Putative uncharacterized protein [Moritella viscosa]|uniref:Uncharacterized protein n=1 Tax=Moritella viscosa TaxID=80854 RepID=A0A1L0AH74_9GAMM|nr:Putative uncharacterized protein [Moritella viscosa]